MDQYVKMFSEVNLSDLPQVGGKNASLGEMITTLSIQGIKVPSGFALTVQAFNEFLESNELRQKLREVLARLDTQLLTNLPEVAKICRDLILDADIPHHIKKSIVDAYERFKDTDSGASFAVRSSATSEDLPWASFAGQHDSFLNIAGEKELLDAIKRCYASLFNDRAIKYRIDHNVDHLQIGISVGVQQMIRSDMGSSGVIFTIDPESGFENALCITASWGLGESIVKGSVDPDEYWVFKPSIKNGRNIILEKKKGKKETMMNYAADGGQSSLTTNEVSPAKRLAWALSDPEIIRLAEWSCAIETHYGLHMDIEWAKDGLTNELFIVQARPETVHANRNKQMIETYHLKTTAKKLCQGKGIGKKVAAGRAVLIESLADAHKVKTGDIIVAQNTDPDWNALLRKAIGIVTDSGGRTSHASIVARELGIPAVVGTGNATQILADGMEITIANIQGTDGIVYEGILPFSVTSLDVSHLEKPQVSPMLILSDPDQAFTLSSYPSGGVGLMRMEFTIAEKIGIHPMALATFEHLKDREIQETIRSLTLDYPDKENFFIETIANSVAKVAAGFYPRPV